MNDNDRCSACGETLHHGVLGGACPRCLVSEMSGVVPEDGAPPESGTLEEEVGSMVGNYCIGEKIGEGGFGVVYLAEQEKPVKRRVALKILKVGMDTKSIISRFETERQLLAQLDHSNIAKVLEAGATDTGRPFFVMELVEGLPITHYCDQKRLSGRERLELFMQVGNAVQHAHQKGVIHRDLKPTNILVASGDSGPEVKVIDFGIAKSITPQSGEGTLLTEHG